MDVNLPTMEVVDDPAIRKQIQYLASRRGWTIERATQSFLQGTVECFDRIVNSIRSGQEPDLPLAEAEAEAKKYRDALVAWRALQGQPDGDDRAIHPS